MKKFFRRLLFWFAISILFFVAYFVYIVDDALSVSNGFRLPDYEKQKIALVIIDVQEGTTGMHAQEQYYIDQAPGLIENINEVISVAYENDVPIIYIQQQTKNWLLNWVDGYALAAGSPGVPIDKRLKIVSITHFAKRKSDAFSSYEFETYLQTLKINRLIITGLDIAYCVGKTSYAAMNRGYKVYIVEDAVISENTEIKDEKIGELRKDGAVIISKSQLKELLGNN